ncbi:MAG: hypothetical protein ABEK16_01085 [Candidatus Nanohalobium sp.]
MSVYFCRECRAEVEKTNMGGLNRCTECCSRETIVADTAALRGERVGA